MNMTAVKAWIMQPTTIHGLGLIVGVFGAFLAHLITHDVATDAAVGIAISGAVKVVLPDNSAASAPIEKLAKDTIQAAVQGRLAVMLPTLFADGVAVLNAVQTPATVTVQQPGPDTTVAVAVAPAAPVVAPAPVV